MNARLLTFVIFVAVVSAIASWSWRAREKRKSDTLNPVVIPSDSVRPVTVTPAAVAVTKGANAPPASHAVKAAQIERIKRDYEDLAAKLAAEFGATTEFTAKGGSFPGGLNAYLRQLALLEREKRKDYAALLTPQELEDLELRDTKAGKEVQRWLGDTMATDEQRRAVFRLQREFDEKYALVFDVAPSALLARESERQALQEKILAVLGPELFGAWLRGESEDFDRQTRFAQQHNIRSDAPLEIWRLKNDFQRQWLEIKVRGGTVEEIQSAQRVLVEEFRARVYAVFGTSAVHLDAANAINWLPVEMKPATGTLTLP